MESEGGARYILKVLKFDYFQQAPIELQLLYYSILFSLFAVAFFWVRKYLKREKERETIHLREDYKEKEQFTLETIISNLKLTSQELHLLEQLAGSADFAKIYTLIESPIRFEAKVELLKKAQESERLLSRIYDLRHKLEFHYNNTKVPFICTQMLFQHAKLECSLQVGHKEILFISPIIMITEKHLYIKPPTSKGEPVNLSRFSYLSCKIRRADGIYAFRLPIVKQITRGQNHLVLGHTNEIRQIVERESERFSVQLQTSLFLLSDHQIGLSTKELQQLREEVPLPMLHGAITDVSLGGLNFQTDEALEEFGEKGVVLVAVPGVNIRDELQARILTIGESRGVKNLHLQFVHLRDIERLKLNKFLLRLKQIQSASEEKIEKNGKNSEVSKTDVQAEA